MQTESVAAWGLEWAWSLPLILANVIFHAYALGLVNRDVVSRIGAVATSELRVTRSVLIVGGTALSATLLHALEIACWAVAYRFLGAAPDNNSALLYSLNAMTSYGHVSFYLEPRWQMMGALEALNGWILFGLTTAFLFSIVQKAWLRAQPG